MRRALLTMAWLAAAGAGAPARAEPPWIDAAARGDLAALVETLSVAPEEAGADRPASIAALPLPPTPPVEVMTATVARATPDVSMDFAGPATPGIAAKAGKADRPALPLPPTPPFPSLGLPVDILLPYTGFYMRPMPALPRLEPQGRLASFGSDRPHADFNPQTDCILDHQRFDSRGTRQRYPHACGPTRDQDFDLPAFTTR